MFKTLKNTQKQHIGHIHSHSIASETFSISIFDIATVLKLKIVHSLVSCLLLVLGQANEERKTL